jgi:hypothetical protein
MLLTPLPGFVPLPSLGTSNCRTAFLQLLSTLRRAFRRKRVVEISPVPRLCILGRIGGCKTLCGRKSCPPGNLITGGELGGDRVATRASSDNRRLAVHLDQPKDVMRPIVSEY